MNQNVKMILTNSFNPDVRVYKEAKYLISKGFNVEILCWDRENEYLDKEFENLEGIAIKRFFPFTRYGTGYKQLIPYIKFIFQVRKYLKNKNYDFVHGHDLDGIIVGYLIKNKKSKLIFDMHEFYEVQGNKRKFKYLYRYVVNLMHNKSITIIYVNKIQISTMKKHNMNKIVYLPNYPSLEHFSRNKKIESNKLRISYIGAVRQYNELKNLMDASIGIENINIYIHGSGVDYFRLKIIENRYNNVTITGNFKYSSIVDLYNNTDLTYIVYNMKNENWKFSYPVKFFESIITKTPMIVSRGSYLEKFVKEHDIGFIIDGDNIDEIRNLINYINFNRNILKEKTKNLELIQYKYSWGNVVNNLNEIYL